MAKSVKREFSLETLESFSGGLNLRADQFNLAKNESPDLLNVMVDPRGGIKQRDGIDRRNETPLTTDIKGLWGYHTQNGANAIIANHGTILSYSTTGNFTTFPAGISLRTDGSRCYGITMNDVAYGVSYDKPSFKWDGTNGADLASPNWAADPSDSAVSGMPQAQYIEFWNNFCWVANVYEDSTGKKSRIRWSQANNPEKWRESDYIDIDIGERGGQITGLAPFGDRLVVFKDNGVYIITGFDSDSFQVSTVTTDVGMIALSSPAIAPNRVYFWDSETGVWSYDRDSIIYHFDSIKPAIEDGTVKFNMAPQMAFGNNLLFVSLDWTISSVDERRTLILDPTINSPVGAWVITDIDAGAMFTYRPPGSKPQVFAACVANTGSLICLDDENNRVTDRYTGTTEKHISSYFTTRWVTGRNPIVNKRWGKPRMITLATATLTLPVEVFKNYDKAQSSLDFNVSITGRTGDSLWDTAKWNNTDPASGFEAVWTGIPNDLIADIKRLPTLGTATSVSMKVFGPTTNNTWEINALAFTYVPRRMR